MPVYLRPKAPIPVIADTPTEPPTLPAPVPRPGGLVVGPEYNGLLARIRVKPTPQLVGWIVNAIEVPRPLLSDKDKVDPRSKVHFQYGNSPAWMAELERLNTPWIAGKLTQPGVGCGFDLGFPAFDMLQWQGNLVRGVPVNAFKYPGWMEVVHQDFNHAPQGYDWWGHPELVCKQTESNGKGDKYSNNLLTDQKMRDTYIPYTAPERMFVATWNHDDQMGLEFFPNLPFETTLDGAPAVIDEYCFYGPHVLGRVRADNGWRYLDYMEPTGNDAGRRVLCTDWVGTPGPPWVDDQRES